MCTYISRKSSFKLVIMLNFECVDILCLLMFVCLTVSFVEIRSNDLCFRKYIPIPVFPIVFKTNQKHFSFYTVRFE